MGRDNLLLAFLIIESDAVLNKKGLFEFFDQMDKALGWSESPRTRAIRTNRKVLLSVYRRLNRPKRLLLPETSSFLRA